MDARVAKGLDNPSGGAAFFASLDKIRTKTREDEALQLYDLAVS